MWYDNIVLFAMWTSVVKRVRYKNNFCVDYFENDIFFRKTARALICRIFIRLEKRKRIQYIKQKKTTSKLSTALSRHAGQSPETKTTKLKLEETPALLDLNSKDGKTGKKSSKS